MTDQIPADKVREILEEWERIKEYADWDDLDTLVKDIRALLPAPPLADMTEEERLACKWMQADTETWGRAVILRPNANVGSAVMLDRWGHIAYEAHDRITPRPDLPRLEWPGDTTAPALPGGWRLADHVTHGRVIVTNSTPDTEDRVYFVAPDPDPTGYDWHRCFPDRLTYIDQESADATD